MRLNGTVYCHKASLEDVLLVSLANGADQAVQAIGGGMLDLGSVHHWTLLANSKAAILTAMLVGKIRPETRC
jgi:hypothetical protein